MCQVPTTDVLSLTHVQPHAEQWGAKIPQPHPQEPTVSPRGEVTPARWGQGSSCQGLNNGHQSQWRYGSSLDFFPPAKEFSEEAREKPRALELHTSTQVPDSQPLQTPVQEAPGGDGLASPRWDEPVASPHLPCSKTGSYVSQPPSASSLIPPTSPNTRSQSLRSRTLSLHRLAPHQLNALHKCPTALRIEFKILNRANKTVYWLGPASAHPIFNSPATRPAWSPHQVEKERRALWVAGTAHSYEGVCTFREVGMGQNCEQWLPLSQPHDTHPLLQPPWAFACIVPSLWNAKFQILLPYSYLAHSSCGWGCGILAPHCSALGRSVVGREESVSSVSHSAISRAAFPMRMAASEASRTVLHTAIPSKPSPGMHTASTQ